MKRIVLMFFILAGTLAHAQYDIFNPTNGANSQSKLDANERRKPKEKDNSPKYDIGIYVTPGVFTLGYKNINAQQNSIRLGINGGLDFRIKPESRSYWWSLGVSLATYGAKSNYETTITSPVTQDAVYGYNYELRSEFSDFIENQSFFTLGIPLGWYKRYDKFQLGVGFELSTIISSKYRLMSGQIATSYHDIDLDVWFDSDLGAHGVGVSKYENTDKKNLDVKRVMISPFLDLSFMINERFSIGAYLGYDLINLYRSGDYDGTELVTISDDNTKYNGVLHSNQVSSVHPWAIGVRLRCSFTGEKSLIKEREKSSTKEKNVEHQYYQSKQYDNEPEIIITEKPSSSCDSAVINLMQLLITRKPVDIPIARAIRMYNDISDSKLKASHKNDYDALVRYRDVYREFKNVITSALQDLDGYRNSPIDVAINCKKALENIPYWKNRENLDYVYEYLENEVFKVINLIDSFVAEGSKMKSAQFRVEFKKITSEFVE